MQNPLIYHITHIDNLAGILEAGCLWCDSRRRAGFCSARRIGYDHIKERRTRRRVPVAPGGVLADYVPFYFCPRSVMLYAIKQRLVAGYAEGDAPIVHLATSVSTVCAARRPCVFTNRHAEPIEAEYAASLDGLANLRWDIIGSNDWGGDDRRPFKQAEFLIHDRCPWSAIERIGVWGPEQRTRVESVLRAADHRPVVEVRQDWYYTK